MMPNAGLEVFSTEDIDHRQSVKIWRQYMAEVFYRLDILSRRDDLMRGSLRKRTIASTAVSAFRADAQRIVRSRELVREDKVDSYIIVLPTNGSFIYRQRGNEHRADSGDVYILKTSDYFEVDISEGAACTNFCIPCSILKDRALGLDDFCARPNFADPLIAATLSDLSRNVLDIDSPVNANKLQDLCLDLVGLMISAPSTEFGTWKYGDAVSELLVANIRRVISDRLADVRFSIADVASACGVSTRQIQHVLQKHGTAFGQELVETRLAKAAQMLKSSRGRPLRIGQIATLCGFASHAHFATRYRRKFGVSPRDHR